MTSVQRKFAAGLVTLFIVLSTSYSGRTAHQTLDGCNGDSSLAKNIQDCLKGKGIKFEKVCTTQDKIEVVLTGYKETPVDCSVINAIRDCVLQYAMDPGPPYEVNISVAPSIPEAPAYLVYKGHVGTGSDPDSMPRCFDALALKAEGTVNFKLCNVERKVSADAKRLGFRIEDLDVKVKKSEGDKLYLQVSGKVRASELSESQVKVRVKDLLEKYTGTRRINTDNLKVLPRNGKDSRIK